MISTESISLIRTATWLPLGTIQYSLWLNSHFLGTALHYSRGRMHFDELFTVSITCDGQVQL